MVLPSVRQEVCDSAVDGLGHSQLGEFVLRVARIFMLKAEEEKDSGIGSEGVQVFREKVVD